MGILRDSFSNLPGIDVYGNLNISNGETQISMDFQGKNIVVTLKNVRRFANIFNWANSLKALKTIGFYLHSNDMDIIVSDEESQILRIGRDARSSAMTKVLGLNHVEVVSLSKCFRMFRPRL